MGALTRGFADKYSDVDMIVLLGKQDEKLRNEITKMGVDEQKNSGVDIDLEVYHAQDFRTAKIDEYRKWDLLHSFIAYDPKGIVKELLKERTQVSKNYWMKRVVICGEHISWYCCPPAKGAPSLIETWIDRGDLISAHYNMNYALDLIIKILFALNKELLPAPKWRVFYSYKLKWLPEGYRKLLEEALIINGLSEADLNRRLSALRGMWRQILPKLKSETGLTTDLIAKLYVKKMVHQK
jgi:hypothetical protein